MKKLPILLLCGLAALFAGCKEDKTETPDLRLFAPEVTDVTGTAASVSCLAAFDPAEHGAVAKGFVYGPAADAPETYVEAEKPVLNGKTLSCRLSGLTPETEYMVYAFVETEVVRIVSEAARFKTHAVAADRPEIEITSLTTLSVTASRGDYTITYTLLNPTDVPFAEPECEATWIHFRDVASGEISFTADENLNAEREATITVVYPGAESRTVVVRQEAAPESPELTITSQMSVTVPATEGTYKITYSVANPVQDAQIAASCSGQWIGSFDASVPGEIAYTVAANPGAARQAEIEVAYPGAESRKVVVRQDAAEERPEPGRTIVLTPETAGWPGSYKTGTVKIGGYSYRVDDVAVFSDKIQFKSGSGAFSNAEEAGVIRRIELVYTSTNEKNIRLYTGDTPNPTSNEVHAEQSADRFVFDCSGSQHRYFTLQNGSGVSYLTSITIDCSSGSTDPEPGKPSFGKPAYTEVTKGSATLRCDFAYDGDDAVTELYFVYRTNTGGEQRCDVTPVRPGTAVGYLTGLTPLTTYTFLLRARIGGELFSSEEASFTTNGESVNPGGNMPYPGWAELPLEVEKSGDYHYLHKFSDGARNYTICYSEEYHCAVWTAHPMHQWYMNGDAGRASFGYDPDIDRSLQPTLSGTYSPSTYHRGHMVASSDRQRSKSMNKQVFYYTNMAPQIQNEFNGGIWNKLEREIQDAYTCSDTLYVVTGSYFGDPSKTCKDTPKKKTVVVPTHFYKVLLRSKTGRTGKSVRDLPASDLKCCVFWLEHSYKYGTKGDISRELMMTVEEAERRTGFTFFPNVPNAPKGTMNPSEWGM